MTLLAPRDSPAEALLSDADFARIAEYSRREFGLFQQENKRQLLHSRLLRLLADLDCPDIATFLDRLESGVGGPEREALIPALTTNVTSFFREAHHFRQFSDGVLHPRLGDLRRGGRLRIWSAGCSEGQEPCSIAMTVLDLLPEAPRLNIRILATDIDAKILARARIGRYPVAEAQSIPATLRAAFSRPAGADHFALDERVTGMIRFAALNLVESWPLRGPFDAIFCRNVAIYFDKPTQARLWSRFAELLAPGGMLFIGHSERVSGPAAGLLSSAGITAYQLTSAAERTGS
ncbi:CheR family methyltransferase [Pseudogemmobacter humi]|uniref:Chemotaxis protein methyltransferase n=1 Tax=Pseudogemmobacter humi TaxID=2483812 RepID=A0A3P5XKK0_9RHOB|nr:protein-glutamate O-methyltransferase CheR [Pseudogemmobacter humi]VDC30714.1 Chemotaxis protein methyltransferase [Pseudogemmobacter humi]